MYNISIPERLEIIKHKLKFISDEQRPRALFVQTLNPLVLYEENSIEELCRLAGGCYQNKSYLANESPAEVDTIVVTSGIGIQSALKEVGSFIGRTEWAKAPAVFNKSIFFLERELQKDLSDPERLVQSVELLAEILYPTYFSFGYEDQGWTKFN